MLDVSKLHQIHRCLQRSRMHTAKEAALSSLRLSNSHVSDFPSHLIYGMATHAHICAMSLITHTAIHHHHWTEGARQIGTLLCRRTSHRELRSWYRLGNSRHGRCPPHSVCQRQSNCEGCWGRCKGTSAQYQQLYPLRTPFSSPPQQLVHTASADSIGSSAGS